jgi:hypothetical protein
MRRVLTRLLPEDRPSIEKRNCKQRDNNERPKYQSVCVSFLSAALALIGFLQVAVQHLAAPAGELSFITLFYGNEGAKFPGKLEQELLVSRSSTQPEGATLKSITTDWHENEHEYPRS